MGSKPELFMMTSLDSTGFHIKGRQIRDESGLVLASVTGQDWHKLKQGEIVLWKEAAESLKAENEKLREALKKIGCAAHVGAEQGDETHVEYLEEIRGIASAALRPDDEAEIAKLRATLEGGE